MATDFYLIGFNRPSTRQEADEWRNAWRSWEHAFIWGTGLGPIFDHPWAEFQKVVRMGVSSARVIPEHTWDDIQEKLRPPSVWRRWSTFSTWASQLRRVLPPSWGRKLPASGRVSHVARSLEYQGDDGAGVRPLSIPRRKRGAQRWCPDGLASALRRERQL